MGASGGIRNTINESLEKGRTAQANLLSQDNIRTKTETTTSAGDKMTVSKTTPVTNETKALAEKYPMNAPEVAKEIADNIDNGVITGPNGETKSDDVDPKWLADKTESIVAANEAKVLDGTEIPAELASFDVAESSTSPAQTMDNRSTEAIDDGSVVGDQRNYNKNMHGGAFGTRGRGAFVNGSTMAVNIVDTATGKRIPVRTILDASRLSRNGYFNSVIHSQFIPNNLTKEFIINQKQGFSPSACVAAIGVYNTEYIKLRVMKLTNANDDLGRVEDDSIKDDMVFRNYLFGGASPKNRTTGKAKVITEEIDAQLTGKLAKRRSDRLGIGLGEAMVMNPPYQFNKRDDPRTNPVYPKIGRVYSTQIMNNWPVVLFQPGRLKYNTGFFKVLGLGAGAGLTESLIRTGGDGVKGAFLRLVHSITDVFGVIGTVGAAIFGGSKIIEFKQSIRLYKKYLSSLLDDLAAIMGLIDLKGKYYGSVPNLNLEHLLPVSSLAGGPLKYYNTQFIPFRCSKDVTGSETFSNQTTTNPIMDKFNSAAEEADNAASPMDKDGLLEKGKAVVKRAGMKMLGSFSEQALVLSGRGRITLPDIFSSSSFSRSISLEFRFHSPYGVVMSQFEDEFVPTLMLMTMALSRQTGKLTYTSPFAVRVYVKNHIMINYGMIESISITRGGDANDWCPNGFPKTITVSLNIKDMEPNISLPLASRGPFKMAAEVMFPASGISEYLASIGGLSMDLMTHNFRKENLKRSISVFTSAWNRFWDPDRLVSGVVNTNIGSNIAGLISGSDLDTLLKLGDGNLAIQETGQRNMIKNKVTPGLGFHSKAMNGLPSGFKEEVALQELDEKALSTMGHSLTKGDSFYDTGGVER